MDTSTPARPWYKEPWPWILMAGPLTVVVAGIFTAWLAYTRADPLVSEDYYRKGLQAGHTIAANERAVAMAVNAELRFSDAGITASLTGNEGFKPPSNLRITISHPTRAGLDQFLMAHGEGAQFQSPWRIPQQGHWILLIEDDLQTWRLLGKVLLPTGELIRLTAGQ